MSGARIPFAAARDRLFFRQFAHINPRFQSPSTSLIVQGLLSTVLLLFLSQFQQHFELAVFAEWLFYMLTATTVFVYRRKRPTCPPLSRLGIPTAACHLCPLRCRRSRLQLCRQPCGIDFRHSCSSCLAFPFFGLCASVAVRRSRRWKVTVDDLGLFVERRQPS